MPFPTRTWYIQFVSNQKSNRAPRNLGLNITFNITFTHIYSSLLCLMFLYLLYLLIPLSASLSKSPNLTSLFHFHITFYFPRSLSIFNSSFFYNSLWCTCITNSTTYHAISLFGLYLSIVFSSYTFLDKFYFLRFIFVHFFQPSTTLLYILLAYLTFFI